MCLSRFLVQTALLVALAASTPAQTAHIKLKNGNVLKGRATTYDASAKVLRFRTEDGREQDFMLDQLDAQSVYLVHASLVKKDSGKGQLQLANFARDAGLYSHAARRYGYAEKADPSLAVEVERERDVLRKRAAEYCMANARDAIAKGKLKDAEEWLVTLLEKLPNEPQAAEASAMLDRYYAAEHNARDDKAEQEYTALLEKDLKKAKTHYDRMIERTREGLTARSSQSVAKWEGALDDGKVVLKEIDRLVKEYPDDARVQEGAEKYRQLTAEHMIDVHLHLASHYTSKGSYSKAMREANAALALDSKSQAALAQRARIEHASSEGLDIF